jgi:hypothetical protein
MPGVDVRGFGKAYLVAAPSVVPAGTYRWDTAPCVVADVPPIPQWLVDLIAPPPKTRQKPPRSHTAQDRDLSPYVRAALEAEVARVRGAANGTRNQILNTAAFSLGQLAAHLNRADAESDLIAAACDAGLPLFEASRTFASGWTAGEREPRDIPEQHRAKPPKSGATGRTEHDPEDEPPPHGDDDAPHERAGGRAAPGGEPPRKPPTDPDAHRVGRLWPGFVELLQARAAGQIPVVPTMIRGLDDLLGGGLPAGQVVLLCAPPGACKTSLALDWAVNHAQRGGRAVFWSLELPPHLVLARIVCQKTEAPWAKVLAGGCLAEAASTGDLLKGVDVHLVEHPGEQGEAAVRALLAPQAPGAVPHLLVLDYVQQLARSETRDQRAAVEEASGRVLTLARETGAAVLAVSSTSRAAYDLGNGGDPDILRVLGMARDTGRLEFDAAAVLGLIKVKDQDAEADPAAERYSKVWAVLAKNRLGMTGRVALEVDGQAGFAREIPASEIGTNKVTPEAMEKAILDAVTLAQVKGEPLTSRNAICDRVRGRRKWKLEAVTDLLSDGRLVGGSGKPYTVREGGE